MMKFTKFSKQKISYAFIFSLFLHLSFLAIAVKKIRPYRVDLESQNKQLNQKISNINLGEINFISPEKLRKIKENQKKQIVANETSGKQIKPKETRFAGEKDQTFDRQTIASTNGAFQEAGLGKKEGSKTSFEQNKEQRKAQGKTRSPQKILALSDLGAPQINDIKKADEETENILKEASKKQTALGLARGKSGINGLAANSDFVEDVPLGDMTNLNTTEFKYYGFYHRIRQKLEQHWGSSIKDKARNLYRSGRRMPASSNLITSVSVTLNERGQIVDMQIEGTSGVRELDQAAIESFNKAGPFPNPPSGLLVGGRATIQWGFVVKS